MHSFSVLIIDLQALRCAQLQSDSSLLATRKRARSLDMHMPETTKIARTSSQASSAEDNATAELKAAVQAARLQRIEAEGAFFPQWCIGYAII